MTQPNYDELFDPSTAPVMEETRRFVAAGKLWAVQSINAHAEIGEWERVTIVGVRPSNKVAGVWEMVEVEGVAPRRDLGRNLAGDDWEWPPKVMTQP